jgi:hypothetical protein
MRTWQTAHSGTRVCFSTSCRIDRPSLPVSASGSFGTFGGGLVVTLTSEQPTVAAVPPLTPPRNRKADTTSPQAVPRLRRCSTVLDERDLVPCVHHRRASGIGGERKATVSSAIRTSSTVTARRSRQVEHDQLVGDPATARRQ